MKSTSMGCSVSSAVIAGTLEMDSLYSQCRVFHRQTMIQCFVVYHKLGFSHIKWSAIREYLGWRGVGVGASGPSPFALQKLCWPSLYDRQAMSVFRSPMWQQNCLPRGQRRPWQNKHAAWVLWKNLRAGPLCQSPLPVLFLNRRYEKWNHQQRKWLFVE